MNYFLTIITILIFSSISQGQSFEGKLTYKVDFKVNEKLMEEYKVTEEMLLNKMKKEGEFFNEMTFYIQGGNYIKEVNAKKKVKFIYKSDQNLIYRFEENFDEVFVTNAKSSSSLNVEIDNGKTQITAIDSIKVIHNDTCKLVKLSWGNISNEYHWYSKNQIKIDSKLFEQHNYEYLNKILSITNSFPLEITKSVGAMTFTMTIEKIEEMKLDEELFSIPELKESKRKSDKKMKVITGNKIMKIIK